MVPGEQEGIWSYDEAAKAWCLPHFYEFQPDLNFANPAVREEFRAIMGLWLQLWGPGSASTQRRSSSTSPA